MEDLTSRLERRVCSLTDLAVVRLVWCLSLALGLALLHPAPLFAAALSGLLCAAATATAVGAALFREPLWPGELGRWDISAILYLLGRSIGGLVDRGGFDALLRSHGLGP